MTYREMCDARKEKMQQRQDSGLISARFPGVSSIVVDMQHNKTGMNKIFLSRTLNYSPGSHAYFHIECLNKECKDCRGGFDVERIVSAMIKGHVSSREGTLACEGNSLTSDRVNISYKVTILYNAN